VWANRDPILDRRSAQCIERITRFQIEPRLFRIPDQQTIAFQAALHAQHNGIEQLRHHGWRRGRQRLEAQLAAVVSVDAVQHQHV